MALHVCSIGYFRFPWESHPRFDEIPSPPQRLQQHCYSPQGYKYSLSLSLSLYIHVYIYIYIYSRLADRPEPRPSSGVAVNQTVVFAVECKNAKGKVGKTWQPLAKPFQRAQMIVLMSNDRSRGSAERFPTRVAWLVWLSFTILMREEEQSCHMRDALHPTKADQHGRMYPGLSEENASPGSCVPPPPRGPPPDHDNSEPTPLGVNILRSARHGVEEDSPLQ